MMMTTTARWERHVKVARIVAPLGLSAVLFVLAYLSSKDSNSGLFPMMLFGVGTVVTLIGAAALFSNK
jgi:ABC-type multidrug transport system fused ATPase/permease subunit